MASWSGWERCSFNFLLEIFGMGFALIVCCKLDWKAHCKVKSGLVGLQSWNL